jgi:hypothetical protein
MDIVRQELGDRLQLIPRLGQRVLCPRLLGGGVGLFDHLGTGPIDLEITRVIQGAGVTGSRHSAGLTGW